MAKGSVYVVRGTITIPSSLGASDKAAILVAAENVRLIRAVITPSADLNSGNDFTFNLGWASAANTHASASTGLQGTSAFALTAADTLASAAAASGDQLELARVAGSLSAGTLTFLMELMQD